jgi:hypothetical protein
MKTLHSLSVVAALGLASTVFAQAQTAPNPTQTEPSAQTSTETTAPSASSSPHQRQATSTSTPESATTGSAEPSAASTEHQREALSSTRVADASPTGKQATAILGMKVISSGESLGEVKEVLRDEKGNASYAVISHGSVMGIGGKRTAIPWVTVKSMMQDDKLVIDRSQLEEAPVLSNDKTPDSSSGKWSRDADAYWRAQVSTRSTSLSTPPASPAAADERT